MKRLRARPPRKQHAAYLFAQDRRAFRLIGRAVARREKVHHPSGHRRRQLQLRPQRRLDPDDRLCAHRRPQRVGERCLVTRPHACDPANALFEPCRGPGQIKMHDDARILEVHSSLRISVVSSKEIALDLGG